eukprot:484159-Amphidinium_carterae.1
MAWRACGKENVKPRDGVNKEPFTTTSRPRRRKKRDHTLFFRVYGGADVTTSAARKTDDFSRLRDVLWCRFGQWKMLLWSPLGT